MHENDVSISVQISALAFALVVFWLNRSLRQNKIYIYHILYFFLEFWFYFIFFLHFRRGLHFVPKNNPKCKLFFFKFDLLFFLCLQIFCHWFSFSQFLELPCCIFSISSVSVLYYLWYNLHVLALF